MQSVKSFFKIFEQLGINHDTTASIFITIFVFGLGLIFTWISGRIKQKIERKNYKRNIIFLLQDFSEACSRQDLLVKKSLIKAGLANGNDFHIQGVAIGTLDYLNNIDLSDLYKNFQPSIFSLKSKKQFSKAISKLIATLYHVKTVNKEMPETKMLFFNIYRENEKKFYSNVNELRKVNDEIASEYTGKEVPIDTLNYISGYFQILIKWFKNGSKTEPIFENEEIVEAVLAYNQKFISHEIAFRTNNIALEASHAFMNVKKIDTELFKLFEHFAYTHRKASKIIKVVIKIIE